MPYEVAIPASTRIKDRISVRVAFGGVYSAGMNNERRIIPRLVNEILRLSLYSSRQFECARAFPEQRGGWATEV